MTDPYGRPPGDQPPPWQQPQQPLPPQGQYPPQQYQPPPRRPKRKHTARNVILIICAAVLVIIVAAAIGSASGKKTPAAATTPTAGAPASAPASHPAKAAAVPSTVTYEVTGSAADVTYGAQGSSLTGHVPMKVTGKLEHADDYSIDAQLNGGGAVHCRILVDGKLISAATATGSYNIASCEIVQDPLSGKWEDANSAG